MKLKDVMKLNNDIKCTSVEEDYCERPAQNEIGFILVTPIEVNCFTWLLLLEYLGKWALLKIVTF